MALGRLQPAEGALQEYLRIMGPAAPYVHLQLAEIAAARGDFAAAVEETDVALVAALPSTVRTEARFALAGYQADGGDPAAALETYANLSVLGASESDRAEALWQAVQLAGETGDTQRYQDS